MIVIRIALALAVTLLAACVSTLPSPEPETPTVASDNNAVIALAKNARDDVSAGRLNTAAANLERALRIESNPTCGMNWRVNPHQGQATLAAQFAGSRTVRRADNTPACRQLALNRQALTNGDPVRGGVRRRATRRAAPNWPK
jgi:hypothetical protein